MSAAFPELIEYSKLPDRPKLAWPSGKGVAFCPVIVVEYYETEPPDGTVMAADVLGGNHARKPQVLRVGHRDYGHRVGFWRMAEFMAAQGVVPTLAIDAMAAEKYTPIVEYAVKAGWEVVCHGIAVTRAITGAMPAVAERAYLKEAKQRVEQATGAETRGWFAPSYGESANTLSLLPQAGFSYDLDWTNDEQPYSVKTDPELVILPLSAELDDNTVVLARGVSPFAYAEMVQDAANRLAKDSATTGRYLSFALSPFISGMPWRFNALSSALTTALALPEVWATQPGKVYDAYKGTA
jgi:peptidoglycan/xylan/chitin deacetylase (PgdA/CDA1 family)